MDNQERPMGDRQQQGLPISDRQINRRTLLRTAAAGTAVGAGALAYSSLPAWARTFANERAELRKALSLPYPKLPAGKFVKSFAPEIEHVVVLMMENHSFDNLLGMVPHQLTGRAHADGLKMQNGKVTNSNPSSLQTSSGTPPYAGSGPAVKSMHATSPCQADNVGQNWNTSHECWNEGKNDGFVAGCTEQAMWYWDKADLPYTYGLAEHFPFGQRYFCSVMAQTYPNRRFFFCGTASGLTATSGATFTTPAENGTIFNLLLKHKIGWKDYVEGGGSNASPLIVPNFSESPGCLSRVVDISEFYKDAKAGTLPAFSFIDPNYTTTSEENPQDIQVGEQFIAKVTNAVMHSPQWHKTALFITYDEHGGYYDHVPPPVAIAPDEVTPQQSLANPANSLQGALNYERYGFRVPMIVVSPWAKKNYISNVVQDHTSITAFIEHKWNLPAMSARDANAHPLTDYFDFKKAAFKKPPKLAAAPALTKGLAACKADGYSPPLPS